MEKKIKSLNELDLNKLNMAIESYVEIKGVIIPLYIHLKDINDYKEHIEFKKIEIIRDNIKLDKTEHPFRKQIELYKKMQEIKYYLDFIDNRPIFNGKTWKEVFLGIDKDDDIVDGLVKIGFSLFDFIKLKNEIGYYIQYLKKECVKTIIELLDYERAFPNITLKDNKMKQYENYMTYTQHMSILQNAFEYTNAVLFPENLGKAYFEYSFRELQLKVMYISMKNKIEGFINKVQSKLMESPERT